MAEHPNVAVMREGYQAFAAGDMETLGRVFADDIVWHEAGRSPLSGDYKGRDQVFGFFGKLIELTGGTFRVEVHDLLANDQHGVALVTLSATRNGRSWSGTDVHVFHVREGQMTEFWDNVADRYGFDELLNS